uniref:THAP-type domain-containing protein n=2 Tax=Parascaris univalens TaxID=6257 RepID=A0A915C780_PARUN
MEEENPLSMMRRVKTEICHGGILRTQPLVIVDDQLPGVCSIDRGDDDEFYEEMDEDDDNDSMQNARFDDTLKTSGEGPNVDTRPGVISLSTQVQPHPRCTVCRRFQDGSVRLFRWPRDLKVRRKWCAFFGLDENELALNLDNSYICSWHFDPDQFLYSDQKVYWAPDVCPRHKIRRPASFEPFPWELAANMTNSSNGLLNVDNKSLQRKRPKLPPPKATEIFFRQSKYRITGKTRHPVAVLRLPNDPLFCYEFSYNRTSHIDGTKFYACLQCRKAKAETRIKDYIRTIHLDGNRLLSRGDPFSGHHFACKPIFDVPHTDDDNASNDFRGNEARREHSSCVVSSSIWRQRAGGTVSCNVPPQLSPMRPLIEHAVEGDSGHISHRMCAERPLNFRDIDEEQFSVLRPRSPRFEEHSKVGASSSECAVERSQLKNVRSNKAALKRSSYRYLLKRRPFNMAGRMLKARCYICLRMLRDAAQLSSHLSRHISEAPICKQCGQRCDADAAFDNKVWRICHMCMNNPTKDSSVMVTDLLTLVADNTEDYRSLDDSGPGSAPSIDKESTDRRSRDQLIVVD